MTEPLAPALQAELSDGLATLGLDRVVFADRGDGLRMLHCDEALGSPDQWQVCELAPASGYSGAMAVWLRPPITAG